MRTARITAFTIFFLVKASVSFNMHNNACEDYYEYFVRFWSNQCYNNPDVLIDTPSIIKRNGYPLEEYKIMTQDGYSLTIFRISSKIKHLKANKSTVFLMHGILTNSAVWVHLGNRSLAFVLADEGYDVWLGNIRGNTFAKFNKHYEISTKDFWDFNLDSLAYFDIGEQLKFIDRKTEKQGSIKYIGHSMGSTLSFMYAARYPSEANNLLSGIIALAPVFYFDNVPLIEFLLKISPPLESLLNRLQIYGLFYQNDFDKWLVYFCGSSPYLCKKVVEVISGHLTNHFRPDDLLLFFSNCPTGTSVQIFKHYLQIVAGGYVRRYDYGTEKNIRYYHSNETEKYDLKNINLPVYLFYGKNDALLSDTSVKRLFNELNSTRKKMMHVPKSLDVTPFNHLDFLWAKDVEQYLYLDLLNILQDL